MGFLSSITNGLGMNDGMDAFGNITGTNQFADAAVQAGQAQSRSAQAGIDEQRRQFDALKELLAPFVTAGTSALSGQKDILGLNGGSAQGAAIFGIEQSPQMQALLARGENSILQNASATGGLRGGNTQAALAQFSPSLLSQLIEQQYGRLGGLSSLGQSSAAMTGNAGMESAGQVSKLLQQQGAAEAGGILAQGGIQRQNFNDLLALGSMASKSAKPTF